MSAQKLTRMLTLKLTDQELQDLERLGDTTGATSQAIIRVLIRDYLPIHVQRLASLSQARPRPDFVEPVPRPPCDLGSLELAALGEHPPLL